MPEQTIPWWNGVGRAVAASQRNDQPVWTVLVPQLSSHGVLWDRGVRSRSITTLMLAQGALMLLGIGIFAVGERLTGVPKTSVHVVAYFAFLVGPALMVSLYSLPLRSGRTNVQFLMHSCGRSSVAGYVLALLTAIALLVAWG